MTGQPEPSFPAQLGQPLKGVQIAAHERSVYDGTGLQVTWDTLTRLGQDPSFQPAPQEEGWDQHFANTLPDAQTFMAGGLSRATAAWDHFFVLANTDEEGIREVRPWITEGVDWPMLPVFHKNHPHGPNRTKKINIVKSMLKRALPPGTEVTTYLQGPLPSAVEFGNHNSIQAHQQFATEEVQAMLSKRVIKRWTEEQQPVVINGLLVCTDKFPKLRLCLNPMYPNLWWEYKRLRYDRLHELVPLSQPGDWAMTTDDKHGYWHVPLHPSMWPYLAFKLEGVVYCFTHLPFGVAPACYVYTRIKEVIFAPLRARGLRILFLIDDQLNLQQGYARAQAQSLAMATLLSTLGFVISIPKCTLVPTRVVKFLGLGVDLDRRRFFIPDEKQVGLLALIQAQLTAKSLTNRQIASLAGKLMALDLALHLAPLLSRGVHKLRHRQFVWDDRFPTTPEWQGELLLIQEFLVETKGKNWFSRRTSLVLVGDASESSLAAYTPNGELHAPIIHPFTPHQCQQLKEGMWSSTARELEALKMTLQVCKEQCPRVFHGHKVLYNTDSQAGTHAVMNMRAGDTLFPLVKEILLFCAREDVQLEVVWRPRDHPEQQHADDLSKEIDEEDWGLHQEVYEALSIHPVLQSRAVTLDVFASPANTKVQHAYFSKFWGPGCLGIDAFAHSWAYPHKHQQLAFINGPWQLVTRILMQIWEQRVNCILLIPDTTFPGEVFLAKLPIRASQRLPSRKDLWQPGALLPASAVVRPACLPVRAYFILW